MIPTTDHNEALAGDTLYSAFLNHEWRTIVLPFIIAGMVKLAATIEDESDLQDFEVRYGALIDDFYNAETPGGTMARHGAHVTHSAAQTTNASVTGTLTWDTEREDTDAYHDTGTNPERLTVPADLGGLYEISCNARWSDNGNPLNNCNLDILLNGTTIIASVMNQKGAFTTGINSLVQHVSCIYPLVAGDYVTVQYRHQSVNGVGITKNADYSPEFKMYRISD